jgi:hypothetical protein
MKMANKKHELTKVYVKIYQLLREFEDLKI